MCAEKLLGEDGVAEDRYCGNCGQELRPGNRFCPNCGQPTAAAQVSTPEAPVQPPLPRGRLQLADGGPRGHRSRRGPYLMAYQRSIHPTTEESGCVWAR